MTYKTDAKALHAGQEQDPVTLPRAVLVYRMTSHQFKSITHAANLFALKGLGNIYTRLINLTTGVLEKWLAELDGGLGALCLSLGIAAIFYSTPIKELEQDSFCQ